MHPRRKLLRRLSEVDSARTGPGGEKFTLCFGDQLPDSHVKLFQYITAGEAELFSDLLKEHLRNCNQPTETWNKRNSEGYTLLQWSVFCKQHEIIKTLLNEGSPSAPGLKLASELGYNEVLTTIISCIQPQKKKNHDRKKPGFGQSPDLTPDAREEPGWPGFRHDVTNVSGNEANKFVFMNRHQLRTSVRNRQATPSTLSPRSPPPLPPPPPPFPPSALYQVSLQSPLPPPPPPPPVNSYSKIFNGKNDIKPKLLPYVQPFSSVDPPIPFAQVQDDAEIHPQQNSKARGLPVLCIQNYENDIDEDLMGNLNRLSIHRDNEVELNEQNESKELVGQDHGQSVVDGQINHDADSVKGEEPGYIFCCNYIPEDESDVGESGTLTYQSGADICNSRETLCNQEPLIAAAAAENFVTTQRLLQSGFSILEPHSPYCNCDECHDTWSNADSLHEVQTRLLKFKAITSTSYMILKEPNPIVAAIRRSETLNELSSIYPENMHEFDQMAANASKLAVDLLDCCRSSDEVKTVLMHDADVDGKIKFKYGLLQLAVGLKQKAFVTHPNCQHVLAQLWLDTLMVEWMQSSLIWKMFYVLKQMLFMPFGCLLEAIAPRRFFRKTLAVPLNRFIYAAFSYIIFLGFLLFCAVYEDVKPTFQQIVPWYDWITAIWVVALSFKTGYSLYIERFVAYWTSWWTIYEMCTVGMFIAACICFVLGRFELINQQSMQLSAQLLIIGSGLYSIAITLAYIRVLQWFHLSRNFGHLIVSISRMTAILLKLLVVFSIVLFAFSIGLYRIYKNFHPIHADNNSTDDKVYFMNYGSTVKVLFWALFGQGEADYATVPNNYQWRIVGDNKTNVSMINSPDNTFTIVIGYLLWGLFHVAFVIILLNMLVAVMTNSYQNVQDNCDIEWKFARTKIWMNYFEDYNTVPAPFNLISIISNVVTKLIRCCKRKRLRCYETAERNKKPCTIMDEIMDAKMGNLGDTPPAGNFYDGHSKGSIISIMSSAENAVKLLVYRYVHEKKLQKCRTS